MSDRGNKWIAPLVLAVILIGLALWDADISRRLHWETERGRLVASLGYWLGHGNVVIPALVLLWLAGGFTEIARLKRTAAAALIAFILSGAAGQVIKHLVGRPRPRLWEQGITHFGPSFADGLDSFPSGHMATSVAVALVLAWNYPKAAPIFMAWAAFVGAARLVGGSHFPLDVLGGALVGLAAGWIVIRLDRLRSARNTRTDG